MVVEEEGEKEEEKRGLWRRIEERRPPHLQSTSASPLLNWIENQDHIIRSVPVQNPSWHLPQVVGSFVGCKLDSN